MGDAVTLEQLTVMVADLAEEIAYGANGHIRPASQNKALAILAVLRPKPVAAPESVAASDICGKVQDRNDPDESFVCVERRGHEQRGLGHRYGPRPAPVEA